MGTEPTLTLSPSGLTAVITPDTFASGGFTLLVDGLPQSHVFVADQTRLLYDYLRRIANVSDLLKPPGQPIRVLHLGAGALSLARYIGGTRPGSEQFVLEREVNLVPFVLASLPLDPGTRVSVRTDDARAGLVWASGVAPFDLIVVDVYSGATTPPQVRTVEFFEQVVALLTDEGVVAVNVADDEGMAIARAQTATLLAVTPNVLVLGPTDVVSNGAEGNAVVVASRGERLLDLRSTLRSAGPHPSGLTGPPDLDHFIAGHIPMTDAATNPPCPTTSRHPAALAHAQNACAPTVADASRPALISGEVPAPVPFPTPAPAPAPDARA
ncbi:MULTISPECIES: spermidine synthase [Subtercola]|uniref:Spermine synthase n=1 Tax=Subtercola vilae TaxID=2056433 RepID=A0A4T2C5G3_9MICO|nr:MULTISPECIES: fused MFS/spermidine synthase [Subtercola]MEA9984578.1 fused MFS/spermidine synthase [Subtercola sp. RTI3]TIH39360.1 hypothetical protein D4765_04630 [Subtercola vilae]